MAHIIDESNENITKKVKLTNSCYLKIGDLYFHEVVLSMKEFMFPNIETISRSGVAKLFIPDLKGLSAHTINLHYTQKENQVYSFQPASNNDSISLKGLIEAIERDEKDLFLSVAEARNFHYQHLDDNSENKNNESMFYKHKPLFLLISLLGIGFTGYYFLNNNVKITDGKAFVVEDVVEFQIKNSGEQIHTVDIGGTLKKGESFGSLPSYDIHADIDKTKQGIFLQRTVVESMLEQISHSKIQNRIEKNETSEMIRILGIRVKKTEENYKKWEGNKDVTTSLELNKAHGEYSDAVQQKAEYEFQLETLNKSLDTQKLKAQLKIEQARLTQLESYLRSLKDQLEKRKLKSPCDCIFSGLRDSQYAEYTKAIFRKPGENPYVLVNLPNRYLNNLTQRSGTIQVLPEGEILTGDIRLVIDPLDLQVDGFKDKLDRIGHSLVKVIPHSPEKLNNSKGLPVEVRIPLSVF